MIAGQAVNILTNEVRVALRGLKTQFSKHPSLVAFFIFVTLAVTSAIVAMFDWVIEAEDVDVDSEAMSPETDLLLLFVFMLFRAAVITQRRVVRNPVMIFYRSQPIRPPQMLMATVLYVIVSILSLVVVALGFFLAALLVTGVRPGVPDLFVPQVVLGVLIAPILGYLIGVLASLQPMYRKAGCLLGLSLIMSLILMAINLGVAEPEFAVTMLAIMLVLVVALLPFVAPLLTEILESHTEAGSLHDPETTTHAWLSWLAYILDWQVYVVARKEILNAMRERDVISAALTSISIGFLMVVLYILPEFSLGDLDDKLMLPVFLAMSLFLAALLHCAMLGAAGIGSEGKRLWLLKILPVKAQLVLKGKGVALIFLTIPSMLFIWLPLPLLAGFPLTVTIFFGLVAAILVLSLTGLGIYMGAVFANFDDANRGQPDFMAQFMIMTFASILSLLLLVLPAAIMLADREEGGQGFLGLTVGAVMVVVAYAIYRACLGGAARAYRVIDIESYG